MKNEIIAHLSAENPWRSLIDYRDVITSTNAVLKQAADAGAPEGTVLIAGQQTQGRGRLGRQFFSPPNYGIYMSILIRPKVRPAELMHLTCAAGVAACSAVEAAAGFRPGIKWTNDIVCGGKKLAGILCEMKLDTFGNIAYAVIGIGTNCFGSASDFPEEIRDTAGSIQMFSRKQFTTVEYSAAFIDAFYSLYQNLFTRKKEIISDYRDNCVTLGKDVRIIGSAGEQFGKAEDITDDGALIIKFPDGSSCILDSGEVSVRGMEHYI